MSTSSSKPYTPPTHHRRKHYGQHVAAQVAAGKVNRASDGVWIDGRSSDVTQSSLDYSRSGAAHRKYRE